MKKQGIAMLLVFTLLLGTTSIPGRADGPSQQEDSTQSAEQTGNDAESTYAGAPSSWAMEEVETAVALGMVPPDWLQENWRQDLTRGEFAALAVYFLSVQYGHGAGTGYSVESFIETYLSKCPGPDGQPLQKADHLAEEEKNAQGAYFSWQGILANNIHIFDDVEYNVFVNLAYLMGIVKGRGEGRYDPDGIITRQEAAALLARTYQVYSTLEPKDGPVVPFGDSNQIADWARENVTAMQSWDILHGDETGAFLPHEHYTREQGVMAFMRLYRNMPVSRWRGTLAPLVTYSEAVEQCRQSGPYPVVRYEKETELCTILYLTYGGVMHAPEPAIFLVYPDSTFKRIQAPGDLSDNFWLNEQGTKLAFSTDSGEQYLIDLQTGRLMTNYEALYEQEGIQGTVEGFYHRPFEELPQELRDSLKWDGQVRTMEGYRFRLRHYIGPNIVVVTTEATEEALRDWLDWQLSVPAEERETPGTDEELRAEYERERGREWLYSVTITDDSYATLPGLKVGNTVEEAEVLGYPMGQRLNDDGEATFGDTWEHSLRVYVENGVVKELYLTWGIGRYTGKYHDL